MKSSRRILSFLLFLLLAVPSLRAGSDPEAKALVERILAQRPLEEITVFGQLRLRRPDRRRTEIPLRYTIQPGAEQWTEIYQTEAAGLIPAERLIIVHQEGKPHQYFHSQATGPGQKFREPVRLTGEQAAIPFAGSDYWLSDLGLEFLHWPEQRMAQTRIKMRMTRPAHAIESINPNPNPNTYSRVVSWIDQEYHVVLYAEAFDVNQRRYKIFSLKGFRRVDGGWHPRELELRNQRTDSMTSIELRFDE
jgi:hypothetical protein